ncbi:MAG: hypothetical protein PWP48_1835 [Clostridiales bacterium]|nr:hypothetical protein [Clostridiales bacterium]
MRKAVIFNKTLSIAILAVFAVSISIGYGISIGSLKADADNEENINGQPVSQPKLLTEEEVIERAEKIIVELEITMPVVNKVPRMIWSDKDKRSFQDGYYTIVPNDAIMMDTLAFNYILPTTGRIRDLHPLDFAHAECTIKTV